MSGLFGDPKPTADEVSQALSLLLKDPELAGAEDEDYPSLIATLLIIAGQLYDTTLTEEQMKEALLNFVDIYSCVTEPDVPEAWNHYLIALVQMGDRLARLQETEPPLEHAALDRTFAIAGMRAAEISAKLANLRLGLSLTDQNQYVGEKPVEFDIQGMADAATDLARFLTDLAKDPAVTTVTGNVVRSE